MRTRYKIVKHSYKLSLNGYAYLGYNFKVSKLEKTYFENEYYIIFGISILMQRIIMKILPIEQSQNNLIRALIAILSVILTYAFSILVFELSGFIFKSKRRSL